MMLAAMPPSPPRFPSSADAHRLAELLANGELGVAGVLSGTSADGIDVALFRPRPRQAGGYDLDVHGFRTVPFAASLRGQLRQVLDGAGLELGALALLHRELGVAFGAAVRRVADELGVSVHVVGSHGQTVWHHDGDSHAGAATLQVGDGDFVAEASGAAVVSDFRQRDIAAGGEGAPIGALVDPWLFPDLPRPGAILNLGGFGNLTLLDQLGVAASFDTGPAGALLDGLARLCLGEEMDADGACAATGAVRQDLLSSWMADLETLLATPPPRSTGRDTYGAAWVEGLVAQSQGAPAADLLATGTRLVADCVAESIRRFGAGLTFDRVVVAGGGVRNTTLMNALGQALAVQVESSARHGVDPDAREALLFGLLGVAHVAGQALPPTGPSERRTPTGALCGRVLGKFSPAPPAPQGQAK